MIVKIVLLIALSGVAVFGVTLIGIAISSVFVSQSEDKGK